MDVEHRFTLSIGGYIFAVDIGRNSTNHKFGQDTIEVHEDIIQIISLKESTRDIAGFHVTTFVSEYIPRIKMASNDTVGAVASSLMM